MLKTALECTSKPVLFLVENIGILTGKMNLPYACDLTLGVNMCIGMRHLVLSITLIPKSLVFDVILWYHLLVFARFAGILDCFLVFSSLFSPFSLRMQESRPSQCWMSKGVS